MQQLYALGLNHQTAPVTLRERVSFTPERLPHALHELMARELVSETVIVSTCNRTELYCVRPAEDMHPLLDWLSGYHAIPPQQLQHHLYTYDSQQSVRHLLRVACGLDSLILGEPQILGQIKTAYQMARHAGTVKQLLSRLFEHSFAVAKQVRTDTAIGSSPVSVAFAAVRLAQQIFGSFQSATALLIGAGETIELAARHLHENGLGRMIVANRTLERARQIALEFSGYAITLQEITEHLPEADIVITATASPTPILTLPDVQRAIKLRKHCPIFMVDIAVPRDIEPAVGELEDIYLYSVDDLNDVIQDNLRNRQQAALQAEEIIDTEVVHFMNWLKSLEVVDTICQLRQQTHTLTHPIAQKAKRLLKNGKPPQEVINYVIHTLTNTWLHTPCNQLRHTEQNEREDLILAAKRLFQLPEQKR